MHIIFVHGMCTTGASWNDLNVVLASEFPKPKDGGPVFVAPLTLPGIDPTETIGAENMITQDVFNDSEVGMDDWVDYVLAAFPSGSGRDVCLIGHSQGGAVVSHVADARPDRIARLIYVAAMLPMQGQSSKQIAAKASAMANPELSIVDFSRLVSVGGLVRQPESPTGAKLKLSNAARNLDRFFLTTEQDGVLPHDLQNQMIKTYTEDGMAITVDSLPAGHLPQYQAPNALAAKLKKWIPTK